MKPDTTEARSKKMIEDEVADYLKVSKQTLRNWRHQGQGPPYFKIGRAVRYDAADLERYLDQSKIMPRN